MVQAQNCKGFTALLLVSCLSFGFAMCKNVLIAIQDPLIEHFAINAVEYNLLQTFYSWPNCLTCVVCGIFIDKIGPNPMIFVAFTSSWIGLLIMAISTTIDKQIGYTLLCISRTIVGPSNEALRIALRIFILKQFDVTKYGTVISVFEGMIFIWLSLINVVMLQIYLSFYSISTTLLIPSIIYPIVAVPLLSYLLHQIYQRRYAKQTIGMELVKQTQKESESTQLIADDVDTSNQGKFRLADIKSFDLTYWFLVLSGGFCGTSFMGFFNIQISFFHHMYGYTYTLATILGVAGSITAITAISICGIVTDKYGIKCKLIVIACCCSSLAHYLYGWVHINLFVTVCSVIVFNIGLGIGAVTYWSSIPVVVNDNMVGTGFGIDTSIIFAFNGICYIIVGLLTSEQDGVKEYEDVQYFLITLPAVAAILIFIVWQIDIRNGGKLENPQKK